MTLASIQFAAAPALSDGVRRLQDQYAALQTALSTGARSDSIAGLGSGRMQVLDLSPAITRLSAWQGNVSAAQSTLSVTQTALSRIAAIATGLHDGLIGLEGGEGSAGMTAAAAQARASLQDLAGLVNTRDGTGYVFAGTDTDDAPVPSADAIGASPFAQAVQQAVSAIGTTGAAAAQAAIAAAAGNNQPGQTLFSAALSVAPTAATGRTVSIGEDETIGIGMVATAGDAAPGGSSTGSPLRDLFGVLAAVSALGGADPGDADTAALVSNLADWSGRIGAQLTGATADLGTQQDVLSAQASGLSRASDALTTRLGAVRDSDPAALSVQITTVQNQLTASYSMIADSKSLSLANFL